MEKILNIDDEVKEMRDRKRSIIRERELRLEEIKREKEKLRKIYRNVLKNMRDNDGKK